MDIFTHQNAYIWFVPVCALAIGFEMYFSYKRKAKNYEFKDVSTNVYFALVNVLLDGLMYATSFVVMNFFYDYRFIDWEGTGVLYWIIAFVGQDFLYYIHHYVDHHSRFFWAVHVTHHNSEYYNISTGFRSPVLQPFYRFMFLIPLILIGIHPLHIMFAYAMNQNYGTLCHTNFIKKNNRKGVAGFLLRIWEYIFVTPSHHRVHHASNIKYLDKNMGMFLIIWDRMFGTFQAEEDEMEYEKLKFGLTKPLEDKGPINIIFHEWKEIFKDFFQRKKHLPLGTRLKYVFMPPGWSHDGSSQTSKELQRELRKESN